MKAHLGGNASNSINKVDCIKLAVLFASSKAVLHSGGGLRTIARVVRLPNRVIGHSDSCLAGSDDIPPSTTAAGEEAHNQPSVRKQSLNGRCEVHVDSYASTHDKSVSPCQ